MAGVGVGGEGLPIVHARRGAARRRGDAGVELVGEGEHEVGGDTPFEEAGPPIALILARVQVLCFGAQGGFGTGLPLAFENADEGVDAPAVSFDGRAIDGLRQEGGVQTEAAVEAALGVERPFAVARAAHRPEVACAAPVGAHGLGAFRSVGEGEVANVGGAQAQSGAVTTAPRGAARQGPRGFGAEGPFAGHIARGVGIECGEGVGGLRGEGRKVVEGGGREGGGAAPTETHVFGTLDLQQKALAARRPTPAEQQRGAVSVGVTVVK